MSPEVIILFFKKALNASEDVKKKALFAVVGFITLLALKYILEPKNTVLSESQQAVDEVNVATDAAKKAIKEINPPSIEETKQEVEKEIKNVQDDVLDPSMD